MEHEQLDLRIPFAKGTLGFVLPKQVAVESFDMQEDFTAPIFSRRIVPSHLHTKTILPIPEDSVIGKGGFGVVHEMLLHPSHRKFVNMSGQKVQSRVHI